MRAAIVLAAGEGRRFGRSPKQLALRAGRPLVAHAVAAARAAPVGRVIVVVGRQGERVARAARAETRVLIVRARGWRRGQGASLAVGIAALWPSEREAFVFLGDMPDVPPGLAARLARRRLDGGSVRPAHGGRPGHPVMLGAGDVASLRGQARSARTPTPPLRQEPRLGRHVAMRTIPADRRCRLDLDRRMDLARRVPALMR